MILSNTNNSTFKIGRRIGNLKIIHFLKLNIVRSASSYKTKLRPNQIFVNFRYKPYM